MDLESMVARGLEGMSVSRAEAAELLAAPDAEVMTIVAAAGRVRRHFFGNKVKLNYLVSLKSGMCPENCSYCSQALGATAQVLRYTWLDEAEAIEQVRAGVGRGASTVCLVASGRGPSRREMDRVAGIVESIREEYPAVNICACLGITDEAGTQRLAQAGVSRYNHNLNTAESFYPSICTSHTHADRVSTVQAVHASGLSACSGLLAGMGESDEQLVDVAFGLRELGADSVPVNFLLPFEGTPLHGYCGLSPQRCLKILAMVRFVHPDIEVRAAAGREYHLRSLQPLALEICNSIFLGDYLTSEGQSGDVDLAMIADAGFVVEELESGKAGQVCAGDNHAMADAIADAGELRLRRRGAGTGLPAGV